MSSIIAWLSEQANSNQQLQMIKPYIDAHIVFEVILILGVLHLLFQKRYNPNAEKLSSAEIDALCDEWARGAVEPLAPEDETLEPARVVEKLPGGRLRICDNENWSEPLVDVASFDFLGLHHHGRVKEQGGAALSKYGCGTCGPRGFYGTLDVHLSLEDSIAKFLGTDAAIIYSYDFATSSSVIPCFSKRNDILLVDKACSFSIMYGVKLSRSTVRMFEHNDMQDLERLLQQVRHADEKRGKKPILNRRFIVTEGLFGNTGTIAPLDKIVDLATKYKFRTILDESWSFGTLGATGRGATEHHGLQASQVDIICASMSNSLASIGGFCAGSMRVIDHQRLSSTGYCFSASLPPFNAVSASTGIEIMKAEGSSLFKKLHSNIKQMHDALTAQVIKANQDIKGRSFVITVSGHESSVLRHLRLEGDSLTREHLASVCVRAADISARRGVAVAVATYSPLDDTAPFPSLRVTCSSCISFDDVSPRPSCLSVLRTHCCAGQTGCFGNCAKPGASCHQLNSFLLFWANFRDVAVKLLAALPLSPQMLARALNGLRVGHCNREFQRNWRFSRIELCNSAAFCGMS